MKIIISNDRVLELTDEDCRAIREMTMDTVVKSHMIISVDLSTKFDQLYNLLMSDKYISSGIREEYHNQIIEILKSAKPASQDDDNEIVITVNKK